MLVLYVQEVVTLFNIVSYYIKWVTTSWTDSIISDGDTVPNVTSQVPPSRPHWPGVMLTILTSSQRAVF